MPPKICTLTSEEDRRGGGSAGEMLENLNSDPQELLMCKKFCNPSTEEAEMGRSRGSQNSQPSPVREFQIKVRVCLKTSRRAGSELKRMRCSQREPKSGQLTTVFILTPDDLKALAFTGTSTRMYTHLHRERHRHTDTQAHMQRETHKTHRHTHTGSRAF